jgi:hypothetical protein
MVTVFVWPGLLHANVGHAAMKVDAGSPPGEIYISWWPAGSGGIIPFLLDVDIPAMLGTFESDDQAEGGVNFHAIQIFGLDEDAIKAWWAGWLLDLNFRLFHHNCAVTVAKALAVGNNDPFIASQNDIWTPFGVYMYARQIQIVKQIFG